MMRALIVLTFRSCFALIWIVATALGARGQERPNILLFITDDESWIERSAYGWSNLPTPAFDRVAKQGLLFTNGFASAPSCAPSRAVVLTGRNFWELRQGAFIQAYVPEEIPLFTHLLEKHGYHAGNTGKGWGPGVSIQGSHHELLGQTYNKIRASSPPPGICPIDYAANFKQFLQDRRSDQPFFFWAGIEEPHGPYGEENYKRLSSEYGIKLKDIPLPPVVEDTKENRIDRANCLYEICYADQQLKQMLAILEQADEMENTLVVVTSDNGSAVSDAQSLRSKASPYDNGVHMPLAICWPAGIAGGRTVTDFVNLRDLAPTFLELAGIDPLPGMSGQSLSPILRSEDSGRIQEERSWMVTGLEWHGEFDPESRSSRSIRNDRYSYIIRYRNVGESKRPLPLSDLMEPYRKEFYDLKNDPWEQKNLIDDPMLSDEIKVLSEKLAAYQRDTEDPRVTGDMEVFRQTREYVQTRKRRGYDQTLSLPFE